ncbi:MAG: hypothetical protein VCF24_10785 [Candidatus Latescibacterota bacterium]|jgi:hypothetical protein
MMEDHGQTDTPAAPMAATAAFVDALATTTHVADVVGDAHAADLVVPGEQLPTSDAAPGQSDDGASKRLEVVCRSVSSGICMPPVAACR